MATTATPTRTPAWWTGQTQQRQAQAPRWDRRAAQEINVGDLERWASVLGGGALTLYGLSRADLPGFLLGLFGGSLVYRGVSGHCPAYGMLGFSSAEPRGHATSIPAHHGVKLDEAITIDRSPERLYQFWRNLENLPRIMRHLESVRSTAGNRSHWVAKAPLGMKVEWDAETITDKANEVISWRSLPGSQVDTAGSVHFRRAPDGGTEVRVTLKYDPPGGKVTAALAKLFGQSPEGQIMDDLRQFKQLMETGEPTTATR
jgi:uncharacterized membrane protein